MKPTMAAADVSESDELDEEDEEDDSLYGDKLKKNKKVYTWRKSVLK